MTEGRVKAALRLITNQEKGGILPLDSQHPPAEALVPSTVCKPDDNISEPNPVQFDRIDGPFICKTTLRMDDLQVLMLLDGNGCVHPLVHTLLISVMPF